MAEETRVCDLVERALNEELTPEEACAHAPELLPQVKSRLENCCHVEMMLDEVFASDSPRADFPGNGLIDRQPPTIPGYEVLGVLGRGGIGIIYRVRHVKLNRISALKMLLSGSYASQLEVTRFMREARAIAALKHPNIVQIYDVHELEGPPYFTMELVDGGSLAEQIANRREDARRAAKIVATLAQAVQAAHEVGIVHRDLKPANVLLTSDGVPKISDFGLATRFADEPSITGHEARLGTPSYMAPEQISGSGGANKPAVDVYALGAILYELLTGRPPFCGDTHVEILRQVMSQEAAPPSRSDARIPRDLQTICLKCLSKEPERRYCSALALADDLHRFLDGLPIDARPLGPIARFGRWCRRNPAAVAISVALALAATFSVWQAARATRANQETQRRLQQVQQANDILASIFENLDPKQVASADRPLQAILAEKIDKAVELLASDSVGDPLEVATTQEKLGLSLIALGEPRKALLLFERAYATRLAMRGPEDRQTIINLDHQAKAYHADRKLDKALLLQERALELCRAKFPLDDPNTLNCMNNLGLTYQELGRPSQALPLQQEVLERMKTILGPDHPDTLSGMNNLAITYLKLQNVDEAMTLFEQTLTIRKDKFGPDHPQTLTSMQNLADAYNIAGRPEQALPLLEETLKLRRVTFGPDHRDTQKSMNELAVTYRKAGKLGQALPLFEESLKLKKAALGFEHPSTLNAMNNLATTYQNAGQLEKALPMLEETLARTTAVLGHNDRLTLTCMENLAAAYLKAEDTSRALGLFTRMLDGHKARLGVDNPELATIMSSTALYLLNAGQPAAAEPILRECLAIRDKELPDSWQTFNARSMLGGALLGQKKYEQAEPILLQGYEGLKARQSQMPAAAKPRLAEAVERLVTLYEATGKEAEEGQWRRNLETLRAEFRTTP